MSKVVLDIETNPIPATKLWMVGCMDLATGVYTEFVTPMDKEELEKYLEKYQTIIGHNSLSFDIPTLDRLLGTNLRNTHEHEDTLVLSRLENPAREGGHSLKNWGEILGYPKGDFEDFESGYCEEMSVYCKRDCEITGRIYELLKKRLAPYGDQSVADEYKVQALINQQIENGWELDQEKCFTLLAELKIRKMELEDDVHKRFIPLPSFVKGVVPKYKKDNTMSIVGLKFLGDSWEHVVGPLSRVEFPEFNLGSRQQIARYLQYFGWKPKEYTEAGNAIVDESVLKQVDIPEAQMIAEYLLVTKRMAQVNSWLDAVEDDGRVHGYVNPLGAITNRMTHSSPNMAQVPAVYSEYGKECREVWKVPKGHKLVGWDASGLELRCLAHYMNDPEYTKELLEGDIHSKNQRAAGLSSRDQAKTFAYAFLYGGGDARIGEIVGGTAADGKRLKKKFLDNTPSLRTLRERVDKACAKGYLKGLDGRKLIVKSAHAALNVLLQSMGAIVMKKAMIIMHEKAEERGIKFKQLASIHDEYQLEVKEENAVALGELSVEAMKEAGEFYNVRCPLDAEYKIGDNWSECH